MRPGSHTDIYAQHVDSSGVIQWALNGIAVCNAIENQLQVNMVSDGSGGIILTWIDNRSGSTNGDIYAQRINAAGIVQWTTNGVPVSTNAANQTYPAIISDPVTHSSIIAWEDKRNGYLDIYAQKINSAGITQWGANDAIVCNASWDQAFPRIVSDGSGGCIVAWLDYRSGIQAYAQKLNASGATQWTTNGVLAFSGTTVTAAYNPDAVTNGSGGIIIVFSQRINGVDRDLFAQNISSSGSVQWGNAGATVAAGIGDQRFASLVVDNLGGVVVAFEDTRNTINNSDIYIQSLSSSGNSLLPANGLAVCTQTNIQGYPKVVLDNSGGAIVTWWDFRNTFNSDIYIDRIPLFFTGVKEQQVDEGQIIIFPNPSSGSFRIQSPNHLSSISYLVSNSLGEVVYQSAMEKSSDTYFDLKLSSGIYFISIINASTKITKKLIVE
jgi:hypothetical protein